MDIVEDVEGGTAAKGHIGEVTVQQHVDGEHTRWEAYQHASIVSPIEAAATLSEMGVEAVKGHHKNGYMKGIFDENVLTVEGENGSAITQDWVERIIAHPNLKIGCGLV